jgi:hypothetical protein
MSGSASGAGTGAAASVSGRTSPLAPDLRELAEVVRQSAEAMYATGSSRGG